MSDPTDLERFESRLNHLTLELAELRREFRRIAEGAAPAPPAERAAPPVSPPATPPAPGTGSFTARHRPVERAAPAIDLESLVGRYGTMALAVLTILMGAGAFLRWAIVHNRLGPEARVLLGAVAAVVLAVTGLRMRVRAVRFGNALLALSLALAHVVAWGAGPLLHVVPAGVALAVAAAASVVLAAFALREADQTLFTVGVGGALLAPFVTASESQSVLALLAYGLIVIGAGMYAMRDRAWPVAERLLLVGGGVYLLAGMANSGSERVERNAPAFFAFACAWCAILLSGARHMTAFARYFLASLVVALAVHRSGVPSMVAEIVVLAALGTLSVYVLLGYDTPRWRGAPVEAFVLPLGLLATVLHAWPNADVSWSGIPAMAWALAALLAARLAGAGGREWHLVMAASASALAIVLALHDHPVLTVALLSLHGTAVALAAIRPLRHPAVLTVAMVVLGTAYLWAWSLLVDRPAYRYAPFFTPASFAALAASAGWWVVAWHVSRAPAEAVGARADAGRAVLRTLGGLATFIWWRAELSHAFSRDAATMLLIAYYATVGVAAILVARWRGIPVVRKAGLVLCIFAALKTVVQAGQIDAIGMRVGTYLLVGGYLLGVAYLYRATDEERGA